MVDLPKSLRRISLLVILLLSLVMTTSACSCFYLRFCEYIAFLQEQDQDYVLAFAQKSQSSDIGMVIEISSVVSGSINSSAVNLDLHKGTSCEIWEEQFVEDQEYLFVIGLWTDQNGNINYSLNPCASSYLKLNGSRLIGDISEDVNELELTELFLIDGCPAISSPTDLDITPVNPSTNHFNFYAHTDAALTMQYELIDLQGYYVRRGKVSITEGISRPRILADDLPAGLYFVKLKGILGEQLFKIIKL